MRRLILKMSMSIDGFIGSPDGRNNWMFGRDHEAKAWSVEALWTAGLHVMGSRTFRDMAAYWPTSTDMFAPPMNQIPKAVFSRHSPVIPGNVDAATPGAVRGHAETGQLAEPQPGAGSWAEAFVASGELAEEIARLKAQEGGPIMAHGGAGFARSLVAHGLVDEFLLLVHPVALGKGLPLFSDIAAPMPLRLMSSRAFPGGSVAQTYQAA